MDELGGKCERQFLEVERMVHTMQNDNALNRSLFQKALNEGMVARDHELKEFERAINSQILQIKGMLMRGKASPSKDYPTEPIFHIKGINSHHISTLPSPQIGHVGHSVHGSGSKG